MDLSNMLNNKKYRKNLSQEDMEIVTMLEKLKKDLDGLHNNFNYITDPVLIDSFIYEINALNLRYDYYYNLCKKHDLVVD